MTAKTMVRAESRQSRNDWVIGEPSIDDVLADEIVHMVMRRDGLDRLENATFIQSVAARINRRPARE
ncbi:hypothetical protein CCC_03174 [Paramagnetospirillum magnetotacticum MS-1]|uniref:Uncharacterized protein n=1 Tax=Paramagnetospirillum magnetotacticum MS-1 TaxID=272627 RepID=A0A0C2V682_PARME|nr:hypothetical protein [Paramagnetospirillum magnetotacticum]KIM00572.1 hypothetical protein CCC_03174 [Paramagnetospirillum magnetotacticum MS-1]